MKTFEGLPAALLLLRQKAGLTQAQLAQRAGMDAAMLSRYERGARLPAVSTLDDILAALDVTISDLGDALEVVTGSAPPMRSGKARMRWVSALTLRPNFSVDALYGSLSGWEIREDRDSADFVASVEYAARGLAEAAVEEYRKSMSRAVLQFPKKDDEE